MCVGAVRSSMVHRVSSASSGCLYLGIFSCVVINNSTNEIVKCHITELIN